MQYVCNAMQWQQLTARDTRAQASGFIVFFLILGISAVLWGLLNEPATMVFNAVGNQTSSSQAQAVIDERQAIWNNMLYFIVILAGIVLLARAVFQSQ